MLNIRIIPHTGIIIKSLGDVLFGQTVIDVEKTLGQPAVKHLSYLKDGLLHFYNPEFIGYAEPNAVFTDNTAYFYDDLELKICFDRDKKVEYIESSAGFSSNKTRVYLYELEVFKIAADELIELLKQKNNGTVYNENDQKNCLYLEIDISVWREMDKADAEEAIKEAQAAGTHEMNKESLDFDLQRYSYFQTIGAGNKGYWRNSRFA